MAVSEFDAAVMKKHSCRSVYFRDFDLDFMFSLRFDFQFLAITQLSNKVRRSAEVVGCFDPLFENIQLKSQHDLQRRKIVY